MTSENLSSKTNNSRSTSPFGLSGMWMKTLFRRNTIMAFVAFMASFSVTVLPMLLFRTSPEGIKYYIESTLTGEFSFSSAIFILYAISLPVMTFDYLHASASCSALHSFPLTRGKLFRSSLVVEFILLVIPIILTGIGICIAGHMVMVTSTYNIGELTTPVNCLKWMIDTIVGSLFVMALSNLAGVIAGKNIIHVLLAFLLNSILSIICLLIDGYANSFIFGTVELRFTEFINNLNPFMWYSVVRGSMLSLEHAPMMLVFVGITAAITVLTGLLYKKVKLEREQDATVFPVVSDFLVIFLTFCVMSAFGFVIASMQPGHHATLPVGPFLIGCLIAGPVSFIVFRMIAESSVRVFNVRALINFIALLVVSAVIFGFTCFDITGQGSKVPDPSTVSRVTIKTVEPFDTRVTLSDSESIKNVTDVHKKIVSHKDDFDGPEDTNMRLITFSAEYVLSDGSTLTREYNVETTEDYSDISAAMDTLSKGDEYNEKIDHYIRKLSISSQGIKLWAGAGDEINVEKDDERPLLMAYLKDHRENGSGYYQKLMNYRDFNEMSFTNDSYGSIEVSHTIDGDKTDNGYFETTSLVFGSGNKHVLKFLQKHGYAAELIKAEDVPTTDVEDPEEIVIEG